MISDDEHRELFEQLGDEQRQAGLAHIAQSVAEFRDALLTAGFRRKEAFRMSRDMLNAMMDRVDEGGEE